MVKSLLKYDVVNVKIRTITNKRYFLKKSKKIGVVNIKEIKDIRDAVKINMDIEVSATSSVSIFSLIVAVDKRRITRGIDIIRIMIHQLVIRRLMVKIMIDIKPQTYMKSSEFLKIVKYFRLKCMPSIIGNKNTKKEDRS